MAGFRKAEPKQSAIKMTLYGLAGSGKTFSALLFTEGISKLDGKRVALVDTERGSDFYTRAVPERAVHPEAFDVDCLYTRSLTEIADAIKSLDPKAYSAVVIDSMTHVWESAKNAYRGKLMGNGQIPRQAWGDIKKPYKDLEKFLYDSPLHVFLCGREGLAFESDNDGGEKLAGSKMKAEGETEHEFNVTLEMDFIRPKRPGDRGAVSAFVKKDRSGILSGKLIVNPCFDSVCKPLLSILGATQAQMPSQDDAAVRDADVLEQRSYEKEQESKEILRVFKARLDMAPNQAKVKKIGEEITADVKGKMLPSDVAELREHYLSREKVASL